MLAYVLRKAPQYLLVLAAAIAINFALPRLAPGDPIDYLLGEQAQLEPAQRAQILREFGLHGSTGEQFARYLVQLGHANLGTSVRYGEPVTSVIGSRLPYTLALVGTAIVASTLLGTWLGVLAARSRGRRADLASLAVVLFLDSTPVFFLGMVLLGVFAVQLGWFPVFGAVGLGGETGLAFGLEFLRRLVLPATTLTVASLGAIFLVTRYSLVATLREDFVLFAEATGLSERRILFRHALRNSLLPIATLVLLEVGFVLGGATVVETVFSYPGLGQLIFESTLARDYPLLQGIFLLLAICVILANLVADLLYLLLDPRVRRPAEAA